MQLKVHQTYTLKNLVTLEIADLEILDIYPYKEADIIYGERGHRGIYLPSTVGRQYIPSGPSCFPVFLAERAENILRFMDQVGGSLIVMLLDANQFLPAPNIPDWRIFGGARHDKHDMIRRAQQLTDLYLDWRRMLGKLPVWYTSRVTAIKAGVN